MFDEDDIGFLEAYINNSSPTGYELKGQALWIDYVKPYVDTHYIDHYYNAVTSINPDASFRVMLEAHADEISWLVNYIDEEGFIHVIKNGGADEMVAPGKHVHIHSANKIVEGVFGWPAIHVRKASPGLDRIHPENLFIDCGFESGKEAEQAGLRVGDVVTFTDHFRILNNTFFLGRALDNRIGGFIIARVAKLIRQNNIRLPYTLYLVNAVQEEVGFNGATMIVQQVKPDISIVTDVTHDTTTPYINKYAHGYTRAGKGPVLAVAPAIQKGLLAFVADVAMDAAIPFQWLAISRETGTDAHAIAFANGGICTVLISPPLRYMHTPVEMVHCRDVEATIRLIYETLIRMDPETLNLRNPFKLF